MVCNIAIIGTGKIGLALVQLLSTLPDAQIAVADCNGGAVMLPDGNFLLVQPVDATDARQIRSFLTGRDVVVSACPFYANPGIAMAAKELGVAYFDGTEDVETTSVIREMAASGGFFAPQCGLAPGVISIIAKALIEEFDEVDELVLRVGALPLYPRNRLGYYRSWSTDGLINEYCRPCEVIQDGQRLRVPAMSLIETIMVDGVPYEAFTTSGGIGSLCDTLAGRVRNLSYKTLRYPGHADAMRVLLDDLDLRNRPSLLVKLFDDAVPCAVQDVVVIYIAARGRIGTNRMEKAYVKKLYGDLLGGMPFTAIQITTASAIAAIVELYCRNAIPQEGFFRQEQIDFETFRSSQFGTVFQI